MEELEENKTESELIEELRRQHAEEIERLKSAHAAALADKDKIIRGFMSATRETPPATSSDDLATQITKNLKMKGI